MKIHRGDLVLSTMGRSFWVLENIHTLSQLEKLNVTSTKLYQPKPTYKYSYPSGARSSTMPRYPRPSVLIDYSIKDSVKAPIKLEFINQKGELINTLFSSESNSKIPEKIITDMSTNQVEYIVDNSLSTEIGFNRFNWDMTESGPWHKTKNRRYKNGPSAAPGKYTIKLTVAGEVYEQTFELLMDPRMEPTVTTEDIAAQVDLQRNINDLLSEARKKLDKLEKEKKGLLKKTDKSAENENRLSQINALIATLKTKEGIYELPRLIDQISYLSFMVRGVDQLPGKDAFDRYQELKIKFNEMGD